MKNPHHKGDPISFYPTMGIQWLRNEMDRANEANKEAVGREKMFQSLMDKERNKIRREEENFRRACCDLEKRFLVMVPEEPTQAD